MSEITIIPENYEITEQDWQQKLDHVAASLSQNQESPIQKSIFEGFMIGFSLIEKTGFKVKQIVEDLSYLLTELLDDASAHLCQGVIACVLFCNKKVAATYEMLMECMIQAYKAVLEGINHMQQQILEKQSKNRQVA